MSFALLIDFGSTYTKLRAIDLDGAELVGTGQGPSTVATDVTVGARTALEDLEQRMGRLPRFRYRLASSSAAGGLRMVTVGLVRELTAEAARRAALGAGAKLVASFAHKLTDDDVESLAALSPDIVLLAGGTDGGDEAVILYNAGRLAEGAIACPMVVAGNRQAADEARQRLIAAGKTVTVTENVMPELNVLNVEPCRAAIRRIFIDHIVHAKGIDRAAQMVDQVLMPTPLAVLEGARLLADGDGGLGPLVVVDVGGATTDVHSVASGEPTRGDVVVRGLPEPYAKRTVEGDLGVRHNARSIVEAVGIEALAAKVGLEPERLAERVGLLERDVGRLPGTDAERALDHALARAAVGIALDRHAGTTEIVHTVSGPVTVQHGKDLSAVDWVIGTGGALAHGSAPEAVLSAALAGPADPFSLRPARPRLMVDKGYVLFACGLLGTVEPQVALALGLANLHPLQKEDGDGRAPAA